LISRQSRGPHRARLRGGVESPRLVRPVSSWRAPRAEPVMRSYNEYKIHVRYRITGELRSDCSLSALSTLRSFIGVAIRILLLRTARILSAILSGVLTRTALVPLRLVLPALTLLTLLLRVLLVRVLSHTKSPYVAVWRAGRCKPGASMTARIPHLLPSTALLPSTS